MYEERKEMKYRIGALVTGTIYDEFEAESEEQAKEMMQKKHGDEQISLCPQCGKIIGRLTVSEDTDSYETEEIGTEV